MPMARLDLKMCLVFIDKDGHVEPYLIPIHTYTGLRQKLAAASLFINKRFVLNEMFQRNASKFDIFYV